MYYTLFSIYFVLVLIDQITKELIYNIANGYIGYSIPIFGDFLKITYIENHGGVFGIFQGKILIFTIISSILIIYLIYSEWNNFIISSYIKKLAIIFIAAGASGNMIDRIFRGYVIDMIDFRSIWNFIFNVADVYIHIGIYILIFIYLFLEKNMKN